MLVVAAMTFTGCNCFKKMGKEIESVKFSCTPEVLTLNNGKVDATITINFPVEYFNDKAIVKVTPVIVYADGEVAGAPFFYQGAKVEDNYKVITDGAVTEKVSFKYTPKMRRSTLQLRVEAKCDCKSCEEFTLFNAKTGEALSKDELKILSTSPESKDAQAIRVACGYDLAQGINTLQQDFKYAQIMMDLKDDYKRVTKQEDSVSDITLIEEEGAATKSVKSTNKADIKYAISSSRTAPKAVKSEAIAKFLETVEANSKNERATQKLYAKGYASPDGKEDFNDKLSKSRSESGQKAMAKLLKEYGIETIDVASFGEDWDGFKELVEKSDMEDKNLILQVLSLYSSASQRETEIKNMSAVFNKLRTEILPELRRTQMFNDVDIVGKSDAEMLDLVKAKKYDELTLEEILFISKQVMPWKARVELLEYAAEKYNDARVYNNLGTLYAKMGQTDKAVGSFEKSTSLGSTDAAVSNNLALAALTKGKVGEAKKYESSATPKTKSAIAAAEGNYNPASTQLTGYNKAIACTQKGDYAAAKSAISKDKSADADYLRAVIASKEGNVKVAATQLDSAIKKNKNLSKKASTDVNLLNLFESGYKL